MGLKKRVDIPVNGLAINGKGSRIYVSGNTSLSDTIIQASVAIFDLNGDLINQSLLGHATNQTTSADALCVYKDRLFFSGVEQVPDDLNYHGLFIATDLNGKTLGEFSLLQNPEESFFKGVVATKEYIIYCRKKQR